MSALRVLRRAARGALENLYLAAVIAGVIAAATVLVGLYGMAIENLRAIGREYELEGQVSAYFDDATSSDARAAALAAAQADPGVASARYVAPEEARAWLAGELPELKPTLDALGDAALPGSLEIVVRDASPAARAALAERLVASGLYADVNYGQAWAGRLQALVSALTVLGLGLGGIVAGAALFVVANTVHLAVYARRDEIEIMRLVGASDRHVLLPYLVEGGAAGLVGGGLALLVLRGAHAALGAQLAPMIPLVFGAAGMPFLGERALAALVLGAVALGVAASWFAGWRFLAKVP